MTDDEILIEEEKAIKKLPKKTLQGRYMNLLESIQRTELAAHERGFIEGLEWARGLCVKRYRDTGDCLTSWIDAELQRRGKEQG